AHTAGPCGGQCDGELKPVPLVTPAGADQPGCGLIVGARLPQPAVDYGRNPHAAETRLSGRNARDPAEQEVADRPKGIVIVAVHAHVARVAVPALPHRRRALLA